MKKDYYGEYIEINADTKVISNTKHNEDKPYCSCQLCLDYFAELVADMLKHIPHRHKET